MITYSLVLPDFHATPNNVTIWDAIPPVVTEELTLRKVYLINEPVTGSAVFPAQTDVEISIVYGPTGADFVGNVSLPAVGDVKLGVTYGANGTQFTGTMSGSGGKRRIRAID